MTSRSCSKSYGRSKVSSVQSASIQFDKLFKENSNRPSAAKSAGTVGRWGITSFTSIRSTNINGCRDDRVHSNFGAKKARVDYGNQNARVTPSSSDPFSFEGEVETKAAAAETPSAPKPKKFFKSRNAPSSQQTEEQRAKQLQDTSAAYRQVPETQYSRARSQRQSSKQSPKGSSKRSQEIANDNSSGAGVDGKPHIVMRICKGTSLIVGGIENVGQNAQEPEPDTYRITQPMASPNSLHIDRKNSSPTSASSSPAKTDRVTRSHQSIVQTTTVSIPIESNTETRRTTRSRAKNLQIDTQSAQAASNSQSSSGLSLTLRKSVTDSNNTLISHYDIVKTESSPSYTSKAPPAIAPLIGRDQPLPASTQELIDILSSDHDTSSTRPEPPVDEKRVSPVPPYDNEPEEIMQVEPEDETLKINQESSSYTATTNDSENVSEPPPPPMPMPMDVEEPAESEQTPGDLESEPDPPSSSLECPGGESSMAPAKSLLDQDWSSGSEDNESVGGGPSEHDAAQSRTLSTSVETLHAPQTTKAPPPSSTNKPLATKKGSIFKSRSAGATNGSKRRALYKHKWCDNDKEGAPDTSAGAHSGAPATTLGNATTFTDTMAFEGDFDDDAGITRVVTYPEPDEDLPEQNEAVTSVRCGKNVKGFYTVVKNVKKAHQIQESGEFQEFNDDVEYILDTLQENNPNATRCLSAIRLASKCMTPAFRMHVRAHGTVAKFFKALHDATKDQSLGLCTATVMFVLSQDQLAMDLDRDCLELMLSLLESDASHKDALDDCGLSRAELLKNKEKVRELCAAIQKQGHAKHLSLDNITVGQLAMETLLSLTSRRAGEWFKEELRELGGLEHIVKTIRECDRHINNCDVSLSGWDEPLLDKLRKVDRCLRVLENVTHMNEGNQVYLLQYEDGVLVSTLGNLYKLCAREIPTYQVYDASDKISTGAVLRECLFAIIKVLINLTHHFNSESFGSRTIGAQNGMVDCTLSLLLHVPDSLPEDKRFDMMMLALILLINLIEHGEDNKQQLLDSVKPAHPDSMFDKPESGVQALIEMFYKQEELARAEEQKTDAILDGKKDDGKKETVSTTAKTQEEFIEETVSKLLQKAGRHMEHTLIAAYVVLLLGYLIMDNKDNELSVRGKLPEGNFKTMVAVLQKFFNFMNLTASNEVSSCGIAATAKVIKFLKMSDVRIEEEKNELPLPAFEESGTMLDLSSS